MIYIPHEILFGW